MELSDDGEPQGTSGAPIVQMLVAQGITNVVVVVTRYFGGIKLGTGGLVRAYTSSAKLGLAAAGVCDVCERNVLTYALDYTYLAKLQNLAAQDVGAKNTGGGRRTRQRRWRPAPHGPAPPTQLSQRRPHVVVGGLPSPNAQTEQKNHSLPPTLAGGPLRCGGELRRGGGGRASAFLCSSQKFPKYFFFVSPL